MDVPDPLGCRRRGPTGIWKRVGCIDSRSFLPDRNEAFTSGSAWVNHQELETGSIETGKLADLIVLDQNLFEIEPEQISDTKVLLTLFGGLPVYGSPSEL